MDRKTVLVVSKMDQIGLDALRESLPAADYDVVYEPGADSSIPAVQSAHAVVGRTKHNIDERFLDSAGNLELIVRGGSGVNNYPLDLAGERSVIVENTPGTNASSVEEMVVASVLDVYRSIREMDEAVKREEWPKAEYKGTTIHGKKIGILGGGQVGKWLVNVTKAMGAEVFVHDPYLSNERIEAMGATPVTLDDVFRGMDVVSLHAPETSETRGLVNEQRLRSMTDRGILVNAARSGLVNYEDLENVLRDRPEMHYVADVHEIEGPGKKRMSALGDQVVLTPHIGAATDTSAVATSVQIATQIRAYFEKGQIINPKNIVGLTNEFTEYGALAEKMGALAREYLGQELSEVYVLGHGSLSPFSEALAYHATLGSLGGEWNLMSAKSEAGSRGIDIDHDSANGRYDLVQLVAKAGDQTVDVRARISTTGSPKLMEIDGFETGFNLSDRDLLVFEYADREGVADLITDPLAEGGYDIRRIQLEPKETGPGNKRAIALLSISKKGMNSGSIGDLVTSVAGQIGAGHAAYVHFD